MFLESNATLFSNIKFFSLSLTILNYFTNLFQIELFSGKHHFISMHLKSGGWKHWPALCSALQLWAALCGPSGGPAAHTAGPVLRYFTHSTRNTGNGARGWGGRRGRISLQQEGRRGAVSLQPRIPGHLQKARTMETSPGECYSGYLGHGISSLKRFSQKPRSKAQVEAKPAVEGRPTHCPAGPSPLPPACDWVLWQHFGCSV